MLFNSIEYLIFLPLVFFLYWIYLYKDLDKRNMFLLLASYLFYGWWDWRFLGLIALSSLIDYGLGIAMEETQDSKKRKVYLSVSLAANLGILGLFKYSNFFIESFNELLMGMGFTSQMSSLQLILPVGISFYTFQTLSYTIDVYRGNMKATRNALDFFTYVSFFPQLVAGPIERAANLLPQFREAKAFDYEHARSGMLLIVWGLFKKIVIADNCAVIVEQIFGDYENQTSLTLIAGAVLFAFQIYGDFSGYSDIAIGTSRLLGFDLMRNFAYPYFSRDIAEFWRRWHISLSTWFRDYLYIPLGGSRGSKLLQIRNVFAIFLVSGFWHGANWTFIVWGGINALCFLPLMLFGWNRKNTNTIAEGRWYATPKEIGQLLLTFAITCIAWIFFRAQNVTEAGSYIGRMFVEGSFSQLSVPIPQETWLFIILLLVLEWFSRNQECALNVRKLPFILRYILYITIVALILFFKPDGNVSFIYFQF